MTDIDQAVRRVYRASNQMQMRDDLDRLIEIVDALCNTLIRTDRPNEALFMSLKSIASRARKLRVDTFEEKPDAG